MTAIERNLSVRLSGTNKKKKKYEQSNNRNYRPLLHF